MRRVIVDSYSDFSTVSTAGGLSVDVDGEFVTAGDDSVVRTTLARVSSSSCVNLWVIDS